MQLPRSMARFNKRILNRVQSKWAWLVPPWAMIIHVGRTSGRTYRNPVMAYRSRGRIVVILYYGAGSDWVRNSLAAGTAEIQRLGLTRKLISPRVVPTSEAQLGPLLRPLAAGVEAVFISDLELRSARNPKH